MGFLDLPPPVRHKIYRLLFTGDKILYPNHSWGKLVEGIALLRCCETTHDEGCAVLYGSNKIVLYPETLNLIWRFLDIIGESKRRLLRRVSINLLDCPDDVESTVEGTKHLVPSLDMLANTPFKTLELHLCGFSPHWPSNRTIKEALCGMRTEILVVSKQAETEHWTDMARNMCASKLDVLLPMIDGSEDEDLFHFQDHWDLDFVVEPPKHYFSSLPPEVRNIIYELLLSKARKILPLDFEDPTELVKEAKEPWRSLRQVIGLLRVSRQIQDDASSIFYKGNVFRLLSREVGDIESWLIDIGLGNRLKLRYFRTDSDRLLRAWYNFTLGEWKRPH